jgi:hypothetical protein
MKVKLESVVFHGLLVLVTLFVLLLAYAAETGHVVSAENNHGTYAVCKVYSKNGCAVWGYNQY